MRPPAALARESLLVGLLALLAVWVSQHSRSIVLDNQVLMGPSLGVFALLEFGWLGLPVGIAHPSAPRCRGANDGGCNQMGPSEVR